MGNIPAILLKQYSVGTVLSDSTEALAAAIPTAKLCMMSRPAHKEATVPPTRQSPAPVSLTTDVDMAGRCNA